MFANYHTHTFRCRHAVGTEREYIENGIISGMTELGFAEHIPYVFPDGHESGHRMYIKDLDNYFETLASLREEYSDRIKLYIGFETEYYPLYFDKTMELICKYPVDYLIMGQHFIDNEESPYLGNYRTSDRDFLKRYVEQASEGLRTGKFSCFAHPDLMDFTGDEDYYTEQMTELCTVAKECDVPLELNAMGYVTPSRCYPSKRFFRIAEKVGNDVVIGCDAHQPDAMLTETYESGCREFLADCGITPVDYIKLKPVK